jgi:hypothetical protein
MASFRKRSAFAPDMRLTSQPVMIKNAVLREHKVWWPGASCARCPSQVSWVTGKLAHAVFVVGCSQGVPVREGLQLLYKIVRDKSIKEALLFMAYFGVFLLIAYAVRCVSPSSYDALVLGGLHGNPPLFRHLAGGFSCSYGMSKLRSNRTTR